MPEIYVDFEYGNLEEVILGVPFMIYPDVEKAKWLQEALKVLPPEEARKVIARSGKNSIQLGKYDAMEKENEELTGILKKHGVKVLRPDRIAPEQAAKNFGQEFLSIAGLTQQYTRDPIVVIGDNVIENSMGTLIRRCEILGYRRLFLDRVLGSNARWVSMPGLDYSRMTDNGEFDKNGFPVLEGGDVIVLGKKILVGTSLNRSAGSSELGYRWLKSYLASQGYDVQRVVLSEDILHLDVALSVPRHGLIVVCPEAFVNGIPLCFQGWKRIEITKDDARHLAANGLPIDSNNYILGYNDRCDGKKVKAGMEAEGIKVYPISFGNHTEDGGSIRCSTHPLYRKLSS